MGGCGRPVGTRRSKKMCWEKRYKSPKEKGRGIGGGMDGVYHYKSKRYQVSLGEGYRRCVRYRYSLMHPWDQLKGGVLLHEIRKVREQKSNIILGSFRTDGKGAKRGSNEKAIGASEQRK